LLAATPTIAQTSGSSGTSTQIWGDTVLDYPHGKDSLFELSIEPKTQVSGEGSWRSLELTPLVEYYPLHWLDLEGELLVSRTHQSESSNTTEITPRLGFRVNLFSNLREREGPVGALFDRVRLATLIRFEYRNISYSDGSPSSHQWRFRARLESKVGITDKDLSRDGTLYAAADVEYYVTLSGDASERFASKLRARVGLGYRFNYQWRAEILYVRDENRKTQDDPFATSTNAADFKVKVFF
jgi:hypothetical protein